MQVRSDLDEHGVNGAAVIQERVTELLDVRQAILAADPRFFESLTEFDELGTQDTELEGVEL